MEVSRIMNSSTRHHFFLVRTSGVLQLISTLFFIVPITVNAAPCFSSSPSIKHDIDIYEPIQATELTPEQHDLVKQMFKRMIGRYTGTTQSEYCKGNVDAVDVQRTEYDADVDVESMLNDGIEISYQLHSHEEKKRIQDALSLYLSATRLGITENTAVGDIQILNLTRNFLVYLRKYVVRTVAGGAIAREEVRSFAIYDRSLMMEYLEYSNGLLAQKMTWTLERK